MNTKDKKSDAPAEDVQEESWGEFFRTVIYAIIIAVIFRTVAYEPFNIPSESMLPNLLYGDYLLVSKTSYGYSKHSLPLDMPLFEGRIFEDSVERGDVAVFKWPGDNSTAYIKRIVGLPGDTIQMINGRLFINGQAVKHQSMRGSQSRFGDDGMPVIDKSKESMISHQRGGIQCDCFIKLQ